MLALSTASHTQTHEYRLCCVWTKRLSALDLTLKRHTVLTFSYFFMPDVFTATVETFTELTLMWENDLRPRFVNVKAFFLMCWSL